ncbi:MAG TPA: acetyltransferase [Gammaproteobacteria bacterium]|nr:acetyltransferase [Gammaproteobacteria bacterium]
MTIQAERDLAEAVRAACIQAAKDGYQNAAIAGLCHDGAWEAAIGAIEMLDVDAVIEQSLGSPG